MVYSGTYVWENIDQLMIVFWTEKLNAVENRFLVMGWSFAWATELDRVPVSLFLRSVEEWLDIDMSLKGVCKSIDETLAMRGVVHREACQFLQAFSLAELVHPESAPATVFQ